MNAHKNSSYETLKNFLMPQLDRSTDIHICLPDGYHHSERRYPVLYLQDGQSAFSAYPQSEGQRLEADEALNRLIQQDKTNGCILIAIESHPEFRRQDYNPVKLRPSDPDPKTAAYMKFLTGTLKPFIDSRYKTLPQREYTGIGGFSAGAACALYIGLKRQDVFSKIAAFSLTLTKSFYMLLQSEPLYRRLPLRLYMYIGRHEESGLPKEIRDCFVDELVTGLESVCKRLMELGYEPEGCRLVLDEHGGHGLSHAAKRFPEAFIWLYETK